MDSRRGTTQLVASGVAGREVLRAAHAVRRIEPAEEGSSTQALPRGVYGFTYSPALAAPLFRAPAYRAFEVHRPAGGGVLVLGFVTADEARQLATAAATVEVHLFADAEGAADTLVAIPYSRIAQHRQYSVRNERAVRLEVKPGAEQATPNG